MSIDDSIEKAFKELDSKEYVGISRALSGYYGALVQAGFDKKQAFELTRLYIKFIYRVSEDELYKSRSVKDDDDDDII